MKKCVKKMFIICGCIIFSQVLKGNMVFAAEDVTTKANVSITAVNSVSKIDVPVDKIWKIKFNQSLDSNSIKNKIKIVNKDNGNETSSNVSLSENDTIVTISSQCNPNTNYSLIIEKDIKSKSNKTLNDPVYVEFKTAGETASVPGKTDTPISYIDDINVSIKENEEFNFPATINATMPDGTTKKVNVSWDKHDEVSNKPGIYTYYGTIEGYSKKACLNLTITDLNTPNNTPGNTTIDSTTDINLTVKQNESFTPPDTINGVTSDGKNVTVKVKWENQITTNNQPGTYTYYGIAEGCLVKAHLNLTIIASEIQSHSELQKNLYNYLSNADNRQSVMTRAVELHGGSYSNNCVYFASEALRRAGLTDLSESVCNTSQLTRQLLNRGWEKSQNLDNLKAGDICFTIDYDGTGPTHTYTFMKWVDPNYHEYAYICDNQGNEYDGDPYHQRNVNFATSAKDPIAYFMYIP